MAALLDPASFEEAAEALAAASSKRVGVRIIGGGTKQGWGGRGPEPGVELRTAKLDRILEHNAGDLTAVLQAGARLAQAHEVFAAAGQMLALDPWLGADLEATIGGILATGDAGPLQHRYGAPRDQVLGMTVAFSDGTIARSGGKVIKNVAGYDLAKLLCGAYGTLGLILSVNLRLHPLSPTSATAVAGTGDAGRLARAAVTLAAQPFELEALDVSWSDGRGRLLARCTGAAAGSRADRLAEAMSTAGLADGEIVTQDGELWEAQRAAQRSRSATALRIAARPPQLAEVIAAVDGCGGTLVGRAGLGISYTQIAPEALASLRTRLPADTHSIVLDAPEAARHDLDIWGPPAPSPTLELMRRVKARFDPAGTCNRGIFVGGI